MGVAEEIRLKNFNLWLLVLVGAAAARGATPRLPVYRLQKRASQWKPGLRRHVSKMTLKGGRFGTNRRLGKAHR